MDGVVDIKLKRTGKPKSRHGCATCRLRRIKCDERPGGCLRCEKYGRQCVGYPGGRTTACQVKAVSLLPKLGQEDTSMAVDCTTGAVACFKHSLKAPPYVSLFSNDLEYESFKLYSTSTTHHLSGFLHEPFFSQHVSQAGEMEPSVRHMIIAIGAVDSQRAPGRHEHLHSTSKDMDRIRYMNDFAMQHYGKALAVMQRSLSQGYRNTRTVLICSMMAFQFESFHGNMKNAIAHARSGLRLMNEWINVGKHPLRAVELSAPPANPLGDDLIRLFVDLNFNMICNSPGGPVRIDALLEPHAEELFKRMPSTFSDIRDANSYYELLIRQTFHFTIPTMRRPDAVSEDGCRNVTSDSPSPEDLLKYEQYLKLYDAWWTAARSLLRYSRASTCLATRASAITLTLCYKKWFGSYLCAFQPEVATDAHYDMFVEVIDLAEELMVCARQCGKSHFMFSGPIVGTLFAAARQCRDPMLRRRAIRLLNEEPRREGLRDSQMLARAAEVLVEIEENGLEWDAEGRWSIPEESRIRVLRVNGDLLTRTGEVVFRLGGLVDGKEQEMSRRVFDWQIKSPCLGYAAESPLEDKKFWKYAKVEGSLAGRVDSFA